MHRQGSPADVDAAVIVRERLLNDRRDLHGPFDIIGDVHGCLDELAELLGELGYTITRDDQGRPVDAAHPEGRTAFFVGDLIDRGPSSVGVLRLAMGMTAAGHAIAVPGNHEAKLIRALDGKNVQVGHGLETTLAELETETPEFRRQVRDWCYDLVAHLVLDDGRLVVAHAGLKEAYHGRASGRVRSFALYGDTTGESDEYGLPVRYPWAEDYRGRAMVVYGHTPTPTLDWVNNTLCLDTGCVFGGRLSALRYPERETVQVSARRVYYEPARPLVAPGRPSDELRISDVTGRRTVETSELGRLTIPAESAAGSESGQSAENGRNAGGDEPVCAAPGPPAVPAADHVAGGHVVASRLPRTSRRGLLAVRRLGRRGGDLRGETHGVAGRGVSAGRRCRLHPHRAGLLRCGAVPRVPGPGAARCRDDGAVRRAGQRLAAAGRGTPSVVVEGRRAAAQPVRTR